jgi:hypothetical protein
MKFNPVDETQVAHRQSAFHGIGVSRKRVQARSAANVSGTNRP